MRSYNTVHDVTALDVEAPELHTRDNGDQFVMQPIGGIQMFFTSFDAWREWHVEMSTVGMNFVVSETLAAQTRAKQIEVTPVQ